MKIETESNTVRNDLPSNIKLYPLINTKLNCILFAFI